jgi:hypothetical protein
VTHTAEPDAGTEPASPDGPPLSPALDHLWARLQSVEERVRHAAAARRAADPDPDSGPGPGPGPDDPYLTPDAVPRILEQP